MFREMRRFKQALSKEETRQLLRECKRAALAMLGDEGYPYVIPVNFYFDEEEDRIYIHGAKVGHKVDALLSCDKVCLTTWDNGVREEGDWAFYVRSCVVFGHATLVSDRELTEEKVRTFALKYSPSPEEVEDQIRRSIGKVQLIAIDIDHITGKLVHEK